jgi:hypothetical protein
VTSAESAAGDIDLAAGTATGHVGTRVSTDGGASFTGFGSADQATVSLCIFDGSCFPSPPGTRLPDKPWLAIATTGGAFDGAAYLVWTRQHYDTGQFELLVSVSKDQGRTYGAPVLLDTSSAAERAGLEGSSRRRRCGPTGPSMWPGTGSGTAAR